MCVSSGFKLLADVFRVGVVFVVVVILSVFATIFGGIIFGSISPGQ